MLNRDLCFIVYYKRLVSMEPQEIRESNKLSGGFLGFLFVGFLGVFCITGESQKHCKNTNLVGVK